MPELPEVETIARNLEKKLKNLTVKEVHILWHRSVCKDHADFLKKVVDSRIERVFRRGKFLCFSLHSGLMMTVHLRMSGKLVFKPSDREFPHIRMRFVFDSGTELFLVDPRKFGRVAAGRPEELAVSRLGPDPLDAQTNIRILQKLSSCRSIKTILLDQHVLAGIGNIYADESLFAAGIHPALPGNALTEKQTKKLGSAIARILHQAIVMQGTTLSDYRTPDQAVGGYQHRLQVYGKNQTPCPKCGTLIEKIRLAQRGTHFCPHCQII